MVNKLIIIISILVYTLQIQYGAIIDAGSSGSRLFIYSWDDRISSDVTPKLSIPVTEADWNKRIQPGFTEYVNNDAGLEEHLNKCLDFAREFFKAIPLSTDKIPLYFYATAGARLLESSVRDRLMNKVRSIMSRSGFYFKEINCKIISGEEEGLFGWLSVNYLKGTLFTPDISYGTLEMGGASTQIALYYTKDILANIYNFNLNNTNYQMYIHSFLKYGINEAIVLSHIEALKPRFIRSNEIEIDHPCFPDGYNMTFDYQGTKYSLWGNANYQKCASLTKSILKIDAECNVLPCSYATAYQPSFEKDPNYKFVAFGAFDSVRTVLQKGDVSVGELNAAAMQFCGMSLDDLEAAFPGNQYSYQFCFYFNYVFNMFYYGFRFDSNKMITYPGTIDGQSISWTSGAMLIQTNLLPVTYSFDGVSIKGFSITSVVLILLMILI